MYDSLRWPASEQRADHGQGDVTPTVVPDAIKTAPTREEGGEAVQAARAGAVQAARAGAVQAARAGAVQAIAPRAIHLVCVCVRARARERMYMCVWTIALYDFTDSFVQRVYGLGFRVFMLVRIHVCMCVCVWCIHVCVWFAHVSVHACVRVVCCLLCSRPAPIAVCVCVRARARERICIHFHAYD